MAGILIHVLVPLAGDSADVRANATLLEKCCFRDPNLERSYRRIFADSAGQPLGLSWDGALEFLLLARKQLAALKDAFATAFHDKSVRISIEYPGRKGTVEVMNCNDIEQVVQLFSQLSDSLQHDHEQSTGHRLESRKA
jgi:hypothetical protein